MQANPDLCYSFGMVYNTTEDFRSLSIERSAGLGHWIAMRIFFKGNFRGKPETVVFQIIDANHIRYESGKSPIISERQFPFQGSWPIRIACLINAELSTKNPANPTEMLQNVYESLFCTFMPQIVQIDLTSGGGRADQGGGGRAEGSKSTISKYLEKIYNNDQSLPNDVNDVLKRAEGDDSLQEEIFKIIGRLSELDEGNQLEEDIQDNIISRTSEQIASLSDVSGYSTDNYGGGSLKRPRSPSPRKQRLASQLSLYIEALELALYKYPDAVDTAKGRNS